MMKNIFLILFSGFFLACGGSKVRSDPSVKALSRDLRGPTLKIEGPTGVTEWNRDTLLKQFNLQNITVSHDPSYAGPTMQYQAIALVDLFADIPVDLNTETLQFNCTDGFSAPISAARLMQKDSGQAQAFIAIEDPKAPWPELPGKKKSAGPFYLIWKDAEKSKIGPEEWPYQLAGFTIKKQIRLEYPHTVPSENLKANDPIQLGYEVFLKNCFACHTLNRDGQSQLGPDLNVPFSPTEYLKPLYFEKLVRRPQSLRYWPQAKMSGFDESQITENDFKHLVKYLEHMSKRKFESH